MVKVTRPTVRISVRDVPSPIVNIRNTTPSWAIVWTDCSSTRKDPPQVLRLRRIPTSM